MRTYIIKLKYDMISRYQMSMIFMLIACQALQNIYYTTTITHSLVDYTNIEKLENVAIANALKHEAGRAT